MHEREKTKKRQEKNTETSEWMDRVSYLGAL